MKRKNPNIALEVVSALLTPAAIISFTRVFEETRDIFPILAAALFSTLVAVITRRARLPLPLAALVSAFVFVVFAINRFAPGTAVLFLIPTVETVETGRFLWAELNEGFKELIAPVPATDSFVLSSMMVAWVMSFLTDWGAIRLRLAFEPVLPASLIFIFASVLGSEDRQLSVSVIFVAAVIAWAVTQRAINFSDNGLWLADQKRRGTANIAMAGGVLGALAIIAGVVLGPSIPGANGEPKIDLNEASRPARRVESPIVDVARQLGPEQRDEVAFTVRANSARYWRTAGLDTYEDDQWRIEGKFKGTDNGKELSGDRSSSQEKETVVQTFDLTAATNIWIPAAYEPNNVSDASTEITWNSSSDSLTVSNDVPSTSGVTYTVESDAPQFSADVLRAANEEVPNDISEQYLSLPTISATVTDEAKRVTQSATNRYDKMIALQNYFREYTYSLDRPDPIPGLDPLEDFLNQQVGFCQQFAGTFAVMARSLGHPARVATGYTWGTPGEEDADGFRTYTVRGRQAHSWPEVYFGDLGWVSFEPTPGRGEPSADHTGVEAIQDSTGPEESAEDAVPPTQSTVPESPSSTTTPSTPDQAAPVPPPSSPNSSGGGGQTDAASQNSGRSFLPPLWLWLPIVSLAAYIFGLPALRNLLRNRRYETAAAVGAPPHLAPTLAWDDATKALFFCFQTRRTASETKNEFADRLQSDKRVDSDALSRLADLATTAHYHPSGLSNQQVEETLSIGRKLADDTYAQLPRHIYYWRLLNPVNIFQRNFGSFAAAVGGRKQIKQLPINASSTNLASDS